MDDDNRIHIEFNPDASLPSVPHDPDIFSRMGKFHEVTIPLIFNRVEDYDRIMLRRYLHGRAVFYRLMRKP